MSLKSRFAKTMGRTAGWGLKTFTSGGSSYPGQLAERIDSNILKDLAKDYRVILITGTNGKTMTTSFARSILATKYGHVLTNSTGSNLKQGIVSTFILDRAPKDQEKIAVLEVDEASVRHITEHIEPELVVITNLFQDQTDRYANVDATLDLIVEGLDKVPNTQVLLNADNPILLSSKIKNPKLYFGMQNDDQESLKPAPQTTEETTCPNCGHELSYYKIAYSNIGDYACENCGLDRPALNYRLDEVIEMTATSSSFVIDGTTVSLNLAGLYNVYNALAAFAVGEHFHVAFSAMVSVLNSVKPIFGRQETVQMEDTELIINLIKNPVGLNQVIDLVKLEAEPFMLVGILNNQPADGRDPNWIQGGQFEALAEKDNLKQVLVAGMEVEVLKARLVEAGFQASNLDQAADTNEIIEKIKRSPHQKIYILATYSAMLDLRKALADQKLVKERMA